MLMTVAVLSCSETFLSENATPDGMPGLPEQASDVAKENPFKYEVTLEGGLKIMTDIHGRPSFIGDEELAGEDPKGTSRVRLDDNGKPLDGGRANSNGENWYLSFTTYNPPSGYLGLGGTVSAMTHAVNYNFIYRGKLKTGVGSNPPSISTTGLDVWMSTASVNDPLVYVYFTGSSVTGSGNLGGGSTNWVYNTGGLDQLVSGTNVFTYNFTYNSTNYNFQYRTVPLAFQANNSSSVARTISVYVYGHGSGTPSVEGIQNNIVVQPSSCGSRKFSLTSDATEIYSSVDVVNLYASNDYHYPNAGTATASVALYSGDPAWSVTFTPQSTSISCSQSETAHWTLSINGDGLTSPSVYRVTLNGVTNNQPGNKYVYITVYPTGW